MNTYSTLVVFFNTSIHEDSMTEDKSANTSDVSGVIFNLEKVIERTVEF